MEKNFSEYFSGKKLYGDDFSIQEIFEWFDDEKEGYANLGAGDKKNYEYAYDMLNTFLGFNELDSKNLDVLGIGSAYGCEFIPIINRIKTIKIIESSDVFSHTNNIEGIPCEYYKPNINGKIEFKNDTFDLITCFGVMHHIPNVSYVMRECYRCLKNGGILMIREPIISMGDWRDERNGLTKRERGIPLQLFRKIISEIGFKIQKESLCGFPLIARIGAKFSISPYNSLTLVRLDQLFSFLFSFNTKYHRKSYFSKIGPTSVFFILKKAVHG